MFATNRVTDNIFLLSTGGLSFCSWIIAFGGACALKPANVAWWIVVYELLLIVGTLLVFLSGTFLHYRMVLLTLLAISISLLTREIDSAFPVYKFASRGGAGAYAAGYIILIMIQFVWVIVFGSEPNSVLGQFGHAWSAMNGSVEHHQRHPNNSSVHQAHHPYPQQTEKQYEMGSTKIMLQPTQPHSLQGHPAASSPSVVIPHVHSTSPVLEYRERVRAIHSYTASADDPNELSFEKDDILEVVDRKGNWWQARKADGTVGIIPSNYVSDKARLTGQ